MWILQLNDMRSPKYEELWPVCKASTQEELISFLEREKVKSYRDGAWKKTFRKGGPLEWFNAPLLFRNYIIDMGTENDFVEKARLQFRQTMESIPNIPKN